MTAAELFVKCLEAEGVELIFGLPGEENLDLLNALSRSPIRFVSVRHEQGAAFMADVYGRVTGRAGAHGVPWHPEHSASNPSSAGFERRRKNVL